jgi:hypothetical protein
MYGSRVIYSSSIPILPDATLFHPPILLLSEQGWANVNSMRRNEQMRSEGHGVRNESRISVAILALMTADRAPLCHDNGDFKLVPFPNPVFIGRSAPHECATEPAALT